MEGRAASQGASHDWPVGTDAETPRPWSGDYGFGSGDRRLAFSRQGSFRHPDPWTPRPAERRDPLGPYLERSASSISIPLDACSQFDGEGAGKTYQKSSFGEEWRGHHQKLSFRLLALAVFRAIRSGNRPMKRLALMIFLNVAYSTAELLIGIFSGRVALQVKIKGKIAGTLTILVMQKLEIKDWKCLLVVVTWVCVSFLSIDMRHYVGSLASQKDF